MDDLDRRILGLLQEDARLTNAQVAAAVGSTEPTVRRRIDRMIAAGIMKIVAVATPQKLGYGTIAILGIQIDHSRLDQIEAAIAEMPEVRFAGVTLGSYDIVLEVWFVDNQSLLEFLHGCLSKIEGIQRIESLQVVKMVKYAYDWSGPSAGATKG